MKRDKLKLPGVLMFLFFCNFLMPCVFAQQDADKITVTGKVTDENNLPLANATVKVAGENTSTMSKDDGTFSINVKKNGTLQFSYVGFGEQEFDVQGNTTHNVQFSQASKDLNAVTVIGYGTQKSRNVTGAVGKISSKQIKEVAVVGLDQAILGRVSGVQVTENSAEPGGEVQIRIRGIASITSGSDPLVVVDGVPMSVGLNAINPNDIETIDILKDAAATAIYGSRASAGVILVTTKRGKAGKVVVAFDAYTGTQSNAKKISLLNGPQFAKLANENLVNGGQAPNPAWSNPSSVVNTDWQDAFFRSSPMSNYNVSLSGGSERSRSFLSLGYTNQDGIIQGSGYKRLTARINLDYDVSNRIKIGATVNFNNEKKNNTRTQEEFWGVLLNAMRQQPTDPIYTDQTGLFGDHLYGFRGWALRRTSYNNTWYALGNPAFTNDYYKSGSENTQLLSNAFGEIELIKGLKFKSIIGYNINNSFGFYNAPYQLPSDVDPTSRSYVNQGWGKGVQWNWVNTLNYTKNFGNHDISVLAGTDALKGTGKGIFGDGQSPPEDQPSISASARAGRNVSGSAYTPFSLFSVLGRINYSYADKYLLSVNFRRDGSSKFGPNNRYGNFPSASVGWRISKERFMESVTSVDELKLRLSYGSVGNQGIPDLQYFSTYGNDGGNFGYSFGSPTALQAGFRPAVLGNPDIKWEKNTEANIGLDASFLKGKITFSADYYKKKLIDLLGTVPIPNYSAPFNGSFLANAFTMENSGLELTAGYRKSFGKVNFSISGNFATINNKVTGLVPGNTSGFLNQSISIIGSAYNDGEAQTRTYVGERIGNFWGYVFDGIIQNARELASSGMPSNVKVGDKRFKDLNGDGKINNDDKQFIGNGLPGYIYGFNLRAEYKGFDISAFFNGQGDVQIANMTKAMLYHMRFHNSTGIVNGSSDLLNSWNGEGTSNTLPRNAYDAPTSNRFFSTDYIENGAFLRLRSLQLGYALPAVISKRVAMSSARIYVSAQNLFTVTDYSGYDPEVGSAQIGTRVQTAGVDYGRFPRARTFIVGLNVQF